MSKSSIGIKNVRIIDPYNDIDSVSDILIENGIMEIESSQSSSQTSEVSNFQDNGDFYLVYDNVGSEWQSYEE